MTAEDIEGFEIEYRDYSKVIDGRVVVVEKVPYLRDPQTDELYLHASTAQQLWDIIYSHTAQPHHQMLTTVYLWQEKAS